MLTQMFLIRHGATASNERKPPILQGNAVDLPLSPRGEMQAQATGRLLSEFPLARVYSSQMLRARQTAAEIAGRQGVETQALDDLHECDVGVWEGLDWERIAARDPEAFRKFLEDPGIHPYLGGESYGDVLRRVQPVFARLLVEHAGQSFAVVAHNVVNRVFLAHALGMTLRRAIYVRQANGCVNLVRQETGELALVTLNSIFHLGDLNL